MLNKIKNFGIGTLKVLVVLAVICTLVNAALRIDELGVLQTEVTEANYSVRKSAVIENDEAYVLIRTFDHDGNLIKVERKLSGYDEEENEMIKTKKDEARWTKIQQIKEQNQMEYGVREL